MSSAEETKSSVTGADKHISQLKHNVEREISGRQEVRVKLLQQERNSKPEQREKESLLSISSYSLFQFHLFPPQEILWRKFLQKSVKEAGRCVWELFV